MKSLRDNLAYRSFITDRNRALEQILDNYLSQIDRILDGLKIRVSEIVTAPFHSQSAIAGRIDHEIRNLIPRITNIFYEMRSDTYLLSYAGEAEAIGRATSSRMKVRLDRAQIERRFLKSTPSGGEIGRRVELALMRLKHRILDAVALSHTLEENVSELLLRVQRAFPSTRKLSRPPKKLPRLREARTPTTKPSLTTGIIDDAAWQDLVDGYTGVADRPRGPEDVTTKEGEERYTWEIEQELTQDFVEEVRSGQHDAAKENGITDFVWVAIVDDRTDECCLWRDGLTTTEIKQRLRSDKRGDECQVEVPPAHFNCRCDLGPITDKEGSEPKEDLGDFETWLTS